MLASVNLYSTKSGEIKNFLETFLEVPITLEDNLSWTKKYNNPIEIVDIIGSFIDNNYKYNIGMWISLDPGILINITDYNADLIIRYMFERFPY
ncbi:MAG: hypothetical protein ACLSW4_02900 [Clostridia bacterium]|jgi:hypothetical protein|nr:hypothetical protein [Clostridium sp.]MEE0127712.1 hypothetical protein [Clostridia bacterium]HJJ12462.1 hypothetical protein [Clostridiaceae bacterium]